MKFPFSRKLALSAEAMAAAAASLAAHGDHPKAAQIAVMAALRADTPWPLAVRARPGKTRIPLDAKMIWLEGSTGSGRHDVAHGLQRAAARAGYRTLTVTPHDVLASRWDPADVRLVDMVTEDDMGPAVSDTLCDPAMPCVVLQVAGQRNDAALIRRTVEAALTALERAEIFDRVIVWQDIDLLYKLDFPRFAARLRSIAERAKALVCTSESGVEMVMTASGPFDDVVLLRSIENHPTAAPLGLGTLSEGEGVLMWSPSLAVRGETDLTRDPVLSESARALIARIAREIEDTPPASDRHRQKIIAQACGYRSWIHARKAA